SESSVAVCRDRAAIIEPAAVHVLVRGSKISAVARFIPLLEPPATSARPSDSTVSVADSRAVRIEAAADHVFVTGLYSSAADRSVLLRPPTTSTRPSLRRTAWGDDLARFIEGAAVHVSAAITADATTAIAHIMPSSAEM